MKVDSSPIPLPPSGPQKPAGSRGAAAVNEPESIAGVSGVSPHANVRLSADALRLRAAASDGSGDIDTARVEALRMSIANGTYQPDPAKIADGMLQSSQDLLKKPSS